MIDVTARLDPGRLGAALEVLLDIERGDLLELAAVEASAMVKDRFLRQGPNWAPLQQRTIDKRRNKNAASIKILRDRGDLFNSMTSMGAKKGSIWENRGRSFVLGSNVKYAATHQFGRGAIPARPYLPEVEALRARLRPKLARALREMIDDAM